MTSLLWLRRDLRRDDHAALARAARSGPVLPLVVVDPEEWSARGALPNAWMAATVAAAAEAYAGRLMLRWGDPATVLPAVAAEVEADTVVLTGATTGYGRRRDQRVEQALAGVDWQVGDWPQLVPPGQIYSQAGTPFKVFGPWFRSWLSLPRPEPVEVEAEWLRVDGPEPGDPQAWQFIREQQHQPGLPGLPPAGERAADQRWQRFLDQVVSGYHQTRDLPAIAGTSHISADLTVGTIHPRRMLADLAGVNAPGVEEYIRQVAWRDFYADVLWHRPDSAWTDFRPGLESVVDDPDEALLQPWREGQTGYPIVDAGLRQLAATGWMHNRVRMIVASFLVKDLHQPWQSGARYFLEKLIDGDLASNSHGWQWVAGTGTDPSPFFRIFNPTSQGEKFDPDGDYVRRWVPELAHLAGKAVHRPWKHAEGYRDGYPRPMVDHDHERRVSLDRYARAREAGPSSVWGQQ